MRVRSRGEFGGRQSFGKSVARARMVWPEELCLVGRVVPWRASVARRAGVPVGFELRGDERLSGSTRRVGGRVRPPGWAWPGARGFRGRPGRGGRFRGRGGRRVRPAAIDSDREGRRFRGGGRGSVPSAGRRRKDRRPQRPQDEPLEECGPLARRRSASAFELPDPKSQVVRPLRPKLIVAGVAEDAGALDPNAEPEVRSNSAWTVSRTWARRGPPDGERDRSSPRRARPGPHSWCP